MPHSLEVKSLVPRGRQRNGCPPILFVHGAYCDAWCWAVNVMPWFAERGYAVHALSLRGHGASPAPEGLDNVTLADYVDDVRAVAVELPASPILIGHSMGATVVERLLTQEPFPGAALVCPVPPSGLLPVLTRLWWGRPDFFWHAQRMHEGMYDPVSLDTLREFYFTKAAPREVLAEARHHLYPESSRAVMELAWRGSTARPGDHDTPLCVIAAGADALFTPEDAQATARRHDAQAIVLEGLPHMLMLEPGWERLAATVDDWIRSSVRMTGA